MSEKCVILGLGNILLKDEGLGVHLIRELEKVTLPKEVELIDGGTASLDALSSLKNLTKLIIIDSVTCGQEPGSVYHLRPDDLRLEPTDSTLSLHQMGLLPTLKAVEKLGNLPSEIIIIGVEPKTIDWGLELSPEVRQKIPAVLNLIFKELALEKVGDKR
ncbi:HyaD/HybD family hydrogenase maturation endopeptidase [Candidatus Omnitrophota bacterium]